MLFSIEHALQDGSITRGGDRRVISKRVLYVELDNDVVTRHLHYAPYLDYRPLKDEEPSVDAILARPECAWIGRDLEQAAQTYAVSEVVPEHLVGGSAPAGGHDADPAAKAAGDPEAGKHRSRRGRRWCSAACWSSPADCSTR